MQYIAGIPGKKGIEERNFLKTKTKRARALEDTKTYASRHPIPSTE
jgi:hypothetical protein